MSTMDQLKLTLPRGSSHPDNLTCAGQGCRLQVAWFVAWLVRSIRAELALRRSIRELGGMSERGLHDFGLSRWDVDRVTRHGRF